MLLSLYLLLLAGLVHAIPPNLSGWSQLIPRAYIFDKFKFIDCEGQDQELLEKAFYNVRDMLKLQLESVTDVQKYFVGMLSNEKPQMTPPLKNKIESFMMFYGQFDFSDQCEIADNIYRAEQVADAVRRIDQIMTDFAFSGSYSPKIFCSEKFFEYVRTEGNQDFYKNTQDAAQREFVLEFGGKAGVCGDRTTSAAMLYPTKGAADDWMIVCPFMFQKWRQMNFRHLSDYRAVPFEGFRGQYMDHIMLYTPEAYIFHELTHSAIIFNLMSVDHNGNQRENRIMLGDMEVFPGQGAYDFHGVEALARTSRNNPVKMVKNADTLTYHAGAVYLGQCNWAPDGVCR
ncbi:hypothetical protein N7492_010227 [Penicillium capsulatum]|uniref:Lysine-specific metallo-endopeptidase domain-containing protein n=1 Tax=Penicillium capsulatum TaxID=69766 RepID=A0A9W9HNX3_9EURO|nr:hypothetical protein N7492_010227 [Penicillium capsulatum]KAJ6112734.1 hypothetical protein N7512_008058 [Penicillium capsulatum]